MEAAVVPFQDEQFFRAPYDNTTRTISAIICVVLVVVVLVSGSLIVAGIGALILALSYAWSPRGYRISGHSIVVKRLIGDARFSLEGIREARPATSDDFRGSIRLLGDGGLFGYYGLFRTSALGESSWYLTSRANVAVVVTAAKTALFSPADRDRFLAAIRSSAPVPLAGPVDAGRPGGTSRSFPVAPFIGILIAVIALATGALALLYSPGLPRYTLTPQSLTIHDRFYPVTLQARNVDVGQIRVIDWDTDPRWQPRERTNGFSNAHYHSGWYRVSGGGRVRLYMTTGRRLVLLPPEGNGAPVLLEVRNPDDFVARLKQEWAGQP